ncbi:thiamine diphosphate-binding protein [Phialemonium atrogriseum]|uniref:Thiamine diphosphate-binding protein n=1 Tax=Phialemonium atrogriseum TaxID=1093897 RepID=A0AAJ0BRT0_9PEZI|nr:thiamine diphosphate-binding protein [Phialemonium atrogriseum]KAK1761944.1 thiamine diphosphate-binding protein [Phialemonium atrogriseum]
MLPQCLFSHARRCYTSQASTPPGRRLNLPIDFSTGTLSQTTGLPSNSPSKRLNLFQSVNSALRTALVTSNRVLCFGEDVGFGGVFRCNTGLQQDFSKQRVFNTPLTEQGIVVAVIGAAAEGMKPVVEIQFADYVFPAFDEIVNEGSKFRYREGMTGCNFGGLVIRMPWDGSPEALFSQFTGFQVAVPWSLSQAKGLLLAAVLESKDPVIFMEPKILYRAAVEEVPEESYTLPLQPLP